MLNIFGGCYLQQKSAGVCNACHLYVTFNLREKCCCFGWFSAREALRILSKVGVCTGRLFSAASYFWPSLVSTWKGLLGREGGEGRGRGLHSWE